MLRLRWQRGKGRLEFSSTPRLPNDAALVLWRLGGLGTNPECALKSTDGFLTSVSRIQVKRRTGCPRPRRRESGLRATSKATMCFEINRCANYVPIPKQIRSTPHQGFGEPKITGPGWEYFNDEPWNQQDEAIPTDSLLSFSAGPAGYEQSHDVS